MNCKVIFTVGKEEISLDLETDLDSPLTDQDIINVLRNDEEQRKALCDLIHSKLYKQSTLETVSLNNIINKEGLLGNCTLDFLKNEFNTVEFPEGVDANILLVDHLSLPNKGRSIYGRIITSQGKELFIVQGTEDDVKKLAGFLRVRQQLEEQSFNFDESSAYYQDLQKILVERNKGKDKLDNIFDLMLEFHYNRSKYQGMYIDNRSAYSILTNIMNVILQYSNRVEYTDDFVNTINIQISHLSNNNKYLSLDGLYGAIQNFHPEILKALKLDTKTKFNNFFSKPASEIKEQLQKVFDDVVDGKNGYYTLLQTLFSAEPEFTLEYVSNTDKGITLKSIPRTLQAKYGISYDTIRSFDIIDADYKGYKIYAFNQDGQTKYIPSRGYITEDLQSKIYDSEQAVREYIDSAVEKQDIKKNSFLEFKYRERYEDNGQVKYTDELDSFTLYSRQSLTTGSIIESLDVPIVENTRILNGEDILFKEDRQNYSSFKKIVNRWNISEETKKNILDSVNNAEKIAIFIYKLNELVPNGERDGQDAIMQEVVDLINNAPKKAYYIESKSWMKGKNKYYYRIIPTDPIQIEAYKRQKRIPVVFLMNAISQVLADKFNVQINMQTSEEIAQNFPDVDANTAKAFIRDGQIYINTTIARSSDLLHEYSHLILGVLKTNPELRRNYEQLMYLVASQVSEEEMNKFRRRYEGISEIDLMEEIFVKKFSDYIMGNINPNLQEIFISQDRFMKDATKIIFNNEIDNLQSFYGRSIESVFTRFSSDVAQLLQTKGLDFSSTKTSRMYSNWISKQIRDGKIKEQCYG